MSGIQERLNQLMNEGDYSTYIKLVEELQSARRTVNLRENIKSYQNQSNPERKESYGEWCFITVNPSPEVSLEVFLKQCQKASTKKWLQEYIYVLEQRGTTEEELGKGFHMHMIIKKPMGKSPGHCVREIGSTFKYCCDISNYHFYNTKWIKEEEYIRKREYILGEKQSTETDRKDLKQLMDKVWRERNHINSSYSSEVGI